MKVLLASKSARRRNLIKSVVDDVTFTESGADEKLPPIKLAPSEAAMFLAEKKALTSLIKHEDSLEDDELVVGCDTVVTLDGEIFGKPKDSYEAFNTLKKLSGKTHKVITAVCILNNSHKHDLFYDTTLVTFNDLTDDMIWDYIKTGDPFDKAGSYGIQNLPESFIKDIDGDLNNVIGLPTQKLKKHLDDFDNFSNFEPKNNKEILEDVLEHHIKHIKSPSKRVRREAKEHLKTKTMPTWALGKLLDLAVDIAGIQRTLNPQTDNKTIFVMAADHGVASEHVSAYPQEVTVQMAENILNGGAGINILAKRAGADVVLLDMGINGDVKGFSDSNEEENVIKIGYGTKDFSEGPAMTREEAIKAILSGYFIARNHIKQNKDNLIGVGELGIGNTTSAAAIYSVLGSLPVEAVTGFGTGIDQKQLMHKIDIVQKAIDINQPDDEDPIDVLTKLGGFEIAGIVGVILAAAACGVPVVIDGYVCSAAALVAYHIEPKTADYMIMSHKSAEPGHQYFYQLLDKEPLLDLDLRLGEGTGSALAMHLVDCACDILKDMATFESANVSTKE